MIAKIEHHPGELFPRVGFIVTTLTGTNRAVVHFYNQRGTAEQWIKEGKEATQRTRLSCHRFRTNEVRLLVGVVLDNLGNLLRQLALPLTIGSRSLTSLQQRLFKTGGCLIRHARYFTLQLVERYLTGGLFRKTLGRMERLASLRRRRMCPCRKSRTEAFRVGSEPAVSDCDGSSAGAPTESVAGGFQGLVPRGFLEQPDVYAGSKDAGQKSTRVSSSHRWVRARGVRPPRLQAPEAAVVFDCVTAQKTLLATPSAYPAS